MSTQTDAEPKAHAKHDAILEKLENKEPLDAEEVQKVKYLIKYFHRDGRILPTTSKGNPLKFKKLKKNNLFIQILPLEFVGGILPLFNI